MTSKVSDKQMKFIDLFCGIGGFHQALLRFDGKCVFACDIDPECRKTYELNYGIKPEGDITEVNIDLIPKFDILCGGFPCQPFSKAGKQKGFNEKRGNLFFSICDIVKKHNPKYIILENVKNLIKHDKGNTWKTIRTNIDKLNYYTYDEPLVLNTLYFGIPQSRERVIILCKRKDIGVLPDRPIINRKLIKNTDLKEIFREDESKENVRYKINEKMQITQKIWDKFIQILVKNKIDIPKYPIWTDWWTGDGIGTSVTKKDKKLSEEENKKNILKKQKDFYKKYKKWIDKNRKFYNDNKNILDKWLQESRKHILWKGSVRKLEWQAGDLKSNHGMHNILWSPRGSGVRVKKLDYSPTLVAMTSMIPIYGKEKRMLSPRECMRLQSFPDDFIINKNDKVAYKQAGNAVNVTMIEKCVQFLVLGKDLFID